MSGLYPNLHVRFQKEGLCPICLMEMELAPRYVCENKHTLCHRCKPYFYNCPTCFSPLYEEQPPSQVPQHQGPPPTHFLPHPLPPQFHHTNPTAPPVEDFQNHERQNWLPPMPSENQELKQCSYSSLGCWVRIPEYLQELHESRCQFRPHLEEENLPTDVTPNQEELVECRFRTVGCNVRTTPWRISIHENHCIYKDRCDGAMGNLSEGIGSITIANSDSDYGYGDPNELVECKYRKYGCMVNMPRRRKLTHEQKCNYSKSQTEDDHYSSSEGEYDTDEAVPCKWTEYGCRVKPKGCRKVAHEEKCNYRMEECSHGCGALFQPARKYAHERSCQLAN